MPTKPTIFRGNLVLPDGVQYLRPPSHQWTPRGSERSRSRQAGDQRRRRRRRLHRAGLRRSARARRRGGGLHGWHGGGVSRPRSRCHARHGTTSLAATTTVARHEQIMAVLETARRFRQRTRCRRARACWAPTSTGRTSATKPRGASRRGDPAAGRRRVSAVPRVRRFARHGTVAPELPGAKEFALACRERGVRTNVGHSWATFEQMAQAVEWGVRHVDHLFCAMSDKTRLRQFQMYPMQGGVLEATLFFDELTTEVIADGKHLSRDLLEARAEDQGARPAGPGDRLQPGPRHAGRRVPDRPARRRRADHQARRRRHDARRQGPGSSVDGMDHMVRTFLELTGRPLWEVIRMATLTPARIAGREREIGSLEVGKRADIVVLSRDLQVQRVFRDGVEITER